MQTVALSWLILEMTNSPLYLGLQGIFYSIPFIASSIVAGAIADRVERKRLLLLTQLGHLLVTGVQAVIVHAGVIEIWHIYAFSALTWICAGFETAARQSLLPSMVSRPQLPSAIALYSTLYRATAVIGPVIGGFVIASVGVAGALYANTAGAVLLVGAIVIMHVSSQVASGTGSIGRSMLDGLQYARADRKLWALMLLQASASLFANFSALLPVYARDILEIGPQGLGVLHSVVGAGSVIGMAAVIALSETPHRGRWILIGSVLYPPIIVGFALSTNFVLSLAFLFAAGVSEMAVGTLRQTVMQLQVAEQFRGRVMSLSSITARGLHPIGNLQSGVFATFIGAPLALLGGAVVALAFAIWVAFRTPELMRAESSALRTTAVSPPAGAGT